MKTGRPTKLTPAVQQKICDAIRAGNYMETAAAYAGIQKTTFHHWMRQGARAQHGLHRDFVDAVGKALADAETHDVALIGKAAAEGNWQASAWRLERKYPDRWGRRDRVDATVRGAIAHAHVDLGRVDLSRVSNEELEALEQIYAKMLPATGSTPDDRAPVGEGGEGAP